MAGALGLLFGFGAGAARNKYMQEQQGAQNAADLLIAQAGKDPSILDSPEAQKIVTKARGKDYLQTIQMALQHHQAMRQQATQEAQTAPQPTLIGGTPEATQGQDQRTVAQTYVNWHNQFVNSPHYQNLPPHVQKEMDKQFELANGILKTYGEIPAEAEKAQATERAKLAPDITAAKAKQGADIATARTVAENTGEARAAKVGTAAAEAGAGASARLAVDASQQALDLAGKKATVAENARRKAAGEAPLTKAETEKISNGIQARAKNAFANYATANPPPSLALRTIASAQGGDLMKDWTDKRNAHIWQTDPEVAKALDLPRPDGLFVAGDRQAKNGVTYERDASGIWHPVK